VSLTLTPMMCAYLLKENKHHQKNSRWSLDQVIDRYAKALQWVFKHQPLMLGIMLSTVILAGVLYWMIPKGFFLCRIVVSSKW
jgi:multidrug efflux pump